MWGEFFSIVSQTSQIIPEIIPVLLSHTSLFDLISIQCISNSNAIGMTDFVARGFDPEEGLMGFIP